MPAPLSLSALTLEYVKVAVAATVNGSAIDPTADAVQMAFPLAGVDPISGDWKTASWETVSGIYYARCLVGPAGTITLAANLYDVWVKVTDTPETPVRKAGQLEIT